MEQLGLKDSSRNLNANCSIDFLFLSMFNTPYMCPKFDVIGRKFFGWELNMAIVLFTTFVIAIAAATAAIGLIQSFNSFQFLYNSVRAARIPAMRFTHKPALGYYSASALDTLQIFSVKVAATSRGLQWPLDVFGIVSIIDSV